MRILQFVYDVEPFDLERTNQMDSGTTVLIGSGTWRGKNTAIDTPAIYLSDADGSTEAHLTKDELRVVVDQLSDLLEGMESDD